MKKQCLWLLFLALVLVLLPGLMLGEEAPAELTLEVKLDKTTVAVGQVIKGTWEAKGGVGEYYYQYIWHVLEGDDIYPVRSDVGKDLLSSSFEPPYGTSGILYVIALDANYSRAEGSAEFTITGAPQTAPFDFDLQLSSDAVAADKGESLTATFPATGGSGVYSYECNWQLYDKNEDNLLGAKGDFITETSNSYQPKYGVRGKVLVTVKDDAGREREKSAWFSITGGAVLQPIQVVITLDDDSVAVDQGEKITASWSITGGEGPYKVYGVSWHIDDSQVAYVDGDALEAQAVFKPLYGQKGKFFIYGRDNLGRHFDSEKEFAITGSEPADPLTLTITLPKDSYAIDKGEKVSASWVAAGGTGPYRYDYSWRIYEEEESRGNYLSGDDDTVQTFSAVVPKYGVKGELQVEVKDKLGQRAEATKEFKLTDAPEVQPLVLELDLSRKSVAVDQGQEITGNWSATGGQEPYTYNYYWRIYEADDHGGATVLEDYEVEATSSSLKPLFGVKGSLSVEVTDQAGRRRHISKEFSITGAAPADPLKLTVNLGASTVAVGEQLAADWSATGGTGPYQYRYNWYVWYVMDTDSTEWKLVDGNDFEDIKTLSIKPRYGKKGQLEVEVKDKLGRQASQSANFAITGDESQPLQLQIQLDKNSVNVGEAVVATCTVNGGKEPYKFDYTWYAKDSHMEDYQRLRSDYGKGPTGSFVPSFGIAGRLEVEVYDSVERRIYKKVDFAIEGDVEVEPLVLSLNLDKNSTAVNQPVKAAWSASGGAKPYTYYVSWRLKEVAQGWNRNVKYLPATRLSEDEFTPAFGLSGEVSVTVKDSRGVEAKQSKKFAVTGDTPKPLQVELSFDKSAVDASKNEKQTARWKASGGTGEYTYSVYWDIYGNEASSNTVRLFDRITYLEDSLAIGYGIKGKVFLSVYDSASRSTYVSKTFEITGSQGEREPLHAEMSLGKEPIKAFETQTVTVSVTGGKEPYTYAFEWLEDWFLEAEQVYARQAASGHASSQAKVPNRKASNYVRVTVKDAEGRVGIFDEYFEVILDVTRGDANADGRVNTADLGAIVEYIINTIPPKSMENANANKDDKVNIDDLVYIINMLVGD